ncbi:mannose-6-phosphate isomerase [Sorangium cellulosum]|uniref:Mannose-6-phosphate isomerase n=1 Tax=Sorangium cellulosum TaxID=56 RepID=A0A150NY78_SORCE|nr:mannose-6-phosphate isomerase [Sorangium cellulosum]
MLAGGAGTRFWPASRAARPKQLLPLLGGEPLITATARRVLPLCARGGSDGWERIWIATGKHLVAPTRAALPDVSGRRLLVEPVPRNTAPCIGWAAATIAREDPDAIVLVLPSDHHIADVPRFLEVLEAAVASARGGAITTIGIRPTHPETGFGYIEVAEAGAGSAAPREVLRFVEKPSRERAAEFLASGRFLWNAGMFIFRAGDMRAAIRAHLPALAEGLDEIDRAAALGAAGEAEVIERMFPRLPAVSIDHGVMEHVGGLAVVPGDFGWSDLGSWQSAWELAEKDERGNSAPAGSVLVDAHGNYLVDLSARAGDADDRRVIALVGVEDLVVVETDDALLIVPRDRAQDVKHVVDALKARGQGRHT